MSFFMVQIFTCLALWQRSQRLSFWLCWCWWHQKPRFYLGADTLETQELSESLEPELQLGNGCCENGVWSSVLTRMTFQSIDFVKRCQCICVWKVQLIFNAAMFCGKSCATNFFSPAQMHWTPLLLDQSLRKTQIKLNLMNCNNLVHI